MAITNKMRNPSQLQPQLFIASAMTPRALQQIHHKLKPVAGSVLQDFLQVLPVKEEHLDYPCN